MAEQTTTQTEGTSTNSQTTTENKSQQAAGNNDWKASVDKIFEKLDSIIDTKSVSVAKSVLRDNGFEDEEVKNLVSQYRQNKQNKSKETETKVTELSSQIEQLNSKLLSERVNSQAFVCGLDLGLDSKTIPYVVKLADMSKAINEKGEISDENIKAALNKVLEDVPSLKTSATKTSGFLKIGADNSAGGTPNQETVLANIFGVNKKKN